MTQSDEIFVASMLAVAIPFAWVGLAITLKRFRAIGWPPWAVVLFFVPIANIISFAMAAIWPEHPEDESNRAPRWLARIVPSDSLGAATLAVVSSAVLSVALVALGTRALDSYGWGLFAAIPFSQGALAAYLYGVHRRRKLYESFGIALLSVGLTVLALLAVALEGAICIAMAAPLALALAAIGAVFGHSVQNRHLSARMDGATLLVLVLIAPMVMGAEAVIPRQAPTYAVTSEVVIDAPPMTVWRNVVRFPDLPPPTETIFLLGVAYPERAKIIGSGVGAIRYCEFSTGNFVEPITAWEPGTRLAFRVAHSAEPMRELSPYPGLQTSHLHGYMISRHGEFRLEALPGGRTRLIGTTWYQHHLWPASYWAVYADAIIHRIHMRVLEHIKRLSEASADVKQERARP
jgi:FtsH-binding integral membrane protein